MRRTYYILSAIFLSIICFSNAANKVILNDISLNGNIISEGKVEYFEASEGIDSLLYNLNRLTCRDYNMVKSRCLNERSRLFNKYSKAVNDSARQLVLNEAGILIESILVNEIFPFWYGTAWDFEGYTNTPGKGKIACGYFVSTTLQHIGFNINRYKLAQQAPEQEAISLSINGDVMRYTGITPSELKRQFIENNVQEGIYFVGLYCHVGYLLFRKKELFFIHANYIGNSVVKIELAEKSDAFPSSDYHISKITANKEMIKSWIFNKEIYITYSLSQNNNI